MQPFFHSHFALLRSALQQHHKPLSRSLHTPVVPSWQRFGKKLLSLLRANRDIYITSLHCMIHISSTAQRKHTWCIAKTVVHPQWWVHCTGNWDFKIAPIGPWRLCFSTVAEKWRIQFITPIGASSLYLFIAHIIPTIMLSIFSRQILHFNF